MPLSESTLSGQITAAIPRSIKTRYSQAVGMPFQGELARAVAQGFIKSLRSEAKAVGAVGNPAAGTGTGINNLSAGRMTGFAISYFRERVGATGAALDLLLQAIFEETVSHLASTTVVSITGFGGSMNSVSGLVEQNVTSNIMAGFSAEARRLIERSKFGTRLIEAISSGFCRDVLGYGKPGSIPDAGSPTGPTLGMFV